MSWLAPAGLEKKCVVRKTLNESVCTRRRETHRGENTIVCISIRASLLFSFELLSLPKTLSVIFCLGGNMKTNMNP